MPTPVTYGSLDDKLRVAYLASLSGQQGVKDFLSKQYADIGPITVGNSAGSDGSGDTSPGNSTIAPGYIWPAREGGYNAYITPPFDPATDGGVFGRYKARFDADGKMVPNSIEFQKEEREGSWFEEHFPEIAGVVGAFIGINAIPVIAGEISAGLSAPITASELPALASADTGMLGFSGSTAGTAAAGAPITATPAAKTRSSQRSP